MKKETDRVRRWRERQKADGKKSFTVLLSRDAHMILAEEKARTGENYAVIVEKALAAMKKEAPRRQSISAPPPLNLDGRMQVPTVAIAVTRNEAARQPRLLVDDTVQYQTSAIMRDHAGKGRSGIYSLNSGDGFISRLFRTSASSLGRKKKWLK